MNTGTSQSIGTYTGQSILKSSQNKINPAISEDKEIKDQVSLGSLNLPSENLPLMKPAYRKAETGDQYLLWDGFDSSRDIVGVTASEGQPADPYKFKIELKDLQPGAELGNLDLYLLISIGQKGRLDLPDAIPGKVSQPWNVAVGAYDSKRFRVFDEKGEFERSVLKDLKFDSTNDCVEFSLDKSVLRGKGWKDGQPVSLQPFTAKDFMKKVIDSIDESQKKPWGNNDTLSAFMKTDDPSGPSSLTPSSPSVTPSPKERDWRDDSIYFVLTDRFADGDQQNNINVNKSDLTKFHGGDLQGVIDKLDYIKDLGMTTVWVTPVMDNQDLFMDSAGYHGYWPVDFFKVDEHLGEMNKFKELVDKAHKKGMKIVLDVPLNHIAWEHPWKNDPSKQGWLHHNGDVQNWNDPWQVENCSMYGLPDLAQENPDVTKYLIDMAKWWIDHTGIDGFRLDAVKHVPLSFWGQFSKEIHAHAGKDFLLVGECFDGDPGKLNSYQKNDMNSLFDIPLYFTIGNVFAHDRSMRELAGQVAHLNRSYDNPEMMSAIVDNHDTKRFLTEAGGDKNKLKLALSFIMTVNRIPTIYYGTEVAMDGDVESFAEHRGPENRKDMEWDKDLNMLVYFKELSSIRNNNIALRKGAMLEMWQDDQIYAYSRMHSEQEALVILNNDHNTQHREIPLRAESKLKNGTILKDLLTGEKISIKDGKIRVQMSGKKARIFVPVEN